jgi:hypothetical protein
VECSPEKAGVGGGIQKTANIRMTERGNVAIVPFGFPTTITANRIVGHRKKPVGKLLHVKHDN